jgi:hypothetical protein
MPANELNNQYVAAAAAMINPMAFGWGGNDGYGGGQPGMGIL